MFQNENLKRILKNFSLTVIANLISLVISLVVSFLIPKLISVEDYGFWQLYIFYTSYIGILHFGWNDGIYLKLGGKHYGTLEKTNLSTQFWLQLILENFISVIIFFIIINLDFESNKSLVLIMLTLTLTISNIRYFPMYILQSTGRIKEYVNMTIAERVSYLFIIIFLVFFGFKSYPFLIASEILCKLVSLIVGVWYIRDIIKDKPKITREVFLDIYQNISIGSKLLLANLAGMMIIGCTRLIIENNWDVTVFAKVSFTITISSLMLNFITSIAIVIFPELKRIEQRKLSVIYEKVSCLINACMGGLLLFYPVFSFILMIWLPQYKDSIVYMGVLFPICIFETKMMLINSTYFKVLRAEKKLLYVNVFALVASVTLSSIAGYFRNIDLAIFSILISIAIRCLLSDMYIMKILSLKNLKHSAFMVLLSIVFVISNKLDIAHSYMIYSFTYIAFLFFYRGDILKIFKNINLK